MSRSISRQVLYYTARDDLAVKVVLHALRQRQRGKNPASSFGHYRNPQVALKEALLTLGFNSLPAFLAQYRHKDMIGRPHPVYPLTAKPRKKPQIVSTAPEAARPNLALHSLVITHPSSVKGFRHQLDRGRQRPSVHIVVVDCRGNSAAFLVRITHDMLPGSDRRVRLRGRIKMSPNRQVWLEPSPGLDVLLVHGVGVQISFEPDQDIALLGLL